MRQPPHLHPLLPIKHVTESLSPVLTYPSREQRRQEVRRWRMAQRHAALAVDIVMALRVIIALRERKWSFSAIAHETGMSRRTIYNMVIASHWPRAKTVARVLELGRATGTLADDDRRVA